MRPFSWEKTLKRWSEAILDSGEDCELPQDARESRWVGYPPATDDQIAEAEQRLRCILPPSYKDFLKISNGWPLVSESVRKLLPIDEVCALSESQPAIVDAWSKVPEIDASAADSTLAPSHYSNAIQISDYGDGCFLLNPLVQTHDGECQACFFANWVPGAECFASFKDLLQNQYESFLAAYNGKGTGGTTIQRRSLRKPPVMTISDPTLFLAELDRLGYFRYCPPDTASGIRYQFLDLATTAQQDKTAVSSARITSPGCALFTKNCGRVVMIDADELNRGRAPYAMSRLRPLLAATGIEFAPLEEIRAGDIYAARMEGIEHQFFRIKDNHPYIEGGHVPINAARYLMYETAKLTTKVLRKRKSPARIATMEQISPVEGRITKLAFVLLDDELSYLIQWSPLLDNFCRPLRPDVW
jgi:hypothetical protein